MSTRPPELPLLPFNPRRGPLRFAGVVYQFVESDNCWYRYILRRYADGYNYWSRTIPIDPRFAFCPKCMGQSVTAAMDYGVLWFQCLEEDCRLRFRFMTDEESDPFETR